MATGGQFYWPSVGTFVAAYGQFFMAANTPAGTPPPRTALEHPQQPRERPPETRNNRESVRQ